jgi:hypothetical protein
MHVLPKQMKAFTQREVEDQLGLRRGTLAECFYRNYLPDDFYFVVGGRRQILEPVVALIEEKLRRDGRLPKPATRRE